MKAVGQFVVGILMVLLVSVSVEGMASIEVVQNTVVHPQSLTTQNTPTPSPTPVRGDCQDTHCVRPE